MACDGLWTTSPQVDCQNLSSTALLQLGRSSKSANHKPLNRLENC